MTMDSIAALAFEASSRRSVILGASARRSFSHLDAARRLLPVRCAPRRRLRGVRPHRPRDPECSRATATGAIPNADAARMTMSWPGRVLRPYRSHGLHDNGCRPHRSSNLGVLPPASPQISLPRVDDRLCTIISFVLSSAGAQLRTRDPRGSDHHVPLPCRDHGRVHHDHHPSPLRLATPRRCGRSPGRVDSCGMMLQRQRWHISVFTQQRVLSSHVEAHFRRTSSAGSYPPSRR